MTAALVPTTTSGRSGLTLAAATAADEGAVRWVVGSVYDATGWRVSSVDTWAIVDGVLVAVSGGAVDLSTAAERRDLLTSGGPRTLLEACATEALRAD